MTRYRALTGPITYHRKAKGLSIQDLAAAVDLNRGTLTEQINGNRPMPWAIAARLAHELDVPPDVLVEPMPEEVTA